MSENNRLKIHKDYVDEFNKLGNQHKRWYLEDLERICAHIRAHQLGEKDCCYGYPLEIDDTRYRIECAAIKSSGLTDSIRNIVYAKRRYKVTSSFAQCWIDVWLRQGKHSKFDWVMQLEVNRNAEIPPAKRRGAIFQRVLTSTFGNWVVNQIFSWFGV